MDIKSVLIEKEDTNTLNVFSSSAILIVEKYVITTSNILGPILHKHLELLEGIEASKLYLYNGKKDFNLRVVWKTELKSDERTTFVSRKANIFAFFKCKNIEKFCRNQFQDWCADFKENNVTVKNLVSMFVILGVENKSTSEDDLKSLLYRWLLNIYSTSLHKGDRIVCRSSPFGTRDFLNSLSEGIISNTLQKSHLLLSDCSSTPGCEGGLVYAKYKYVWPLGIIISSLNWWRKEWAGFTLIANVQPIICQIIGLDLIYIIHYEIRPKNQVLATSENSLAQINCGTDWGTCILLSKEKGIFVTNSHVVREGLNIRIIWKNKAVSASVIYKNPDDSIFDLAVVKCLQNVSLMSSCEVTVAKTYNCGDTVYCAGYPLLSTLSSPAGATITRGVISAYSPYMIKTTCGVFPGFSGGAVLNSDGALLGIVVCNTRLTDIDVTYPKLNMAVPYRAVSNIITEYFQKNEDHHVLTKLNSTNPEAIRTWKKLEGKL